MMLRRERKPSLRVREIQQAEEQQPLQIQIRKTVKCQKRLQQQARQRQGNDSLSHSRKGGRDWNKKPTQASKRNSESLKERWERLHFFFIINVYSNFASQKVLLSHWCWNATLTLRRLGTAFDRKMLQHANSEEQKKAVHVECVTILKAQTINACSSKSKQIKIERHPSWAFWSEFPWSATYLIENSFMKMVALTSGKQRAIHGPAVNVYTHRLSTYL